MSDVMSAAQIAASTPQRFEENRDCALERARARVEAAGQWSESQHLGRRWPVGCVALEITQRCNLDCDLCYLSESSQALKDLPLEEVYRRIAMIRARNCLRSCGARAKRACALRSLPTASARAAHSSERRRGRV